MISRKYSLKSKSSFKYLYKKGFEYSGRFFIVKYLISDNNEGLPLFGIVISNKFAKKSVTKTKVKRIFLGPIGEYVRANQGLAAGQFVFIPKKQILSENGRITDDVEAITAEINTFLSKVVVSRSG